MDAEWIKVLTGVVALAAFMRASINQVRGEIRDLAARQRADYDKLYGMIAALSNKVAETDAKLSALSDRVTALSNKLAETDIKVSALSEKLTALSDRVTALSGKVAETNVMVTALSDRVGALSVKLTGTDAKMASQSEKVARIEGMLIQQLDSSAGRQALVAQVVDPPTTIGEQKPTQPRPQAVAAQATPSS